jgi:uncharacterized protein
MTTLNETSAEQWATLNVLTDHRCRELLAQHRWGRVATNTGTWPTILPMNYGFDGESLVVKVSPHSVLTHPHLTLASFEIDDADVGGAWGWSVVVHGPAVDITDALDAASARLRAVPLQTFAPGRKERWIRIAATQISGRSFGVVPGWSDTA